jgi:hypothetical protein
MANGGWRNGVYESVIEAQLKICARGNINSVAAAAAGVRNGVANQWRESYSICGGCING